MKDCISRQAAIDAADRADCPELAIEDVKKVTDEVIKELKQLPPEPQWIPCSERLPEDDMEVFVYLFDRPSPYIAWVTDCHWFTEDFQVEKENYPLAWMPLPQPWEGAGA